MVRALLALAFVFPMSTSLRAGELILELRVFNGSEEVTGHTRVFVHRASDRSTPFAEARGPRIELKVPEGIYDVQAIQERDGQVVNIQWANRLVVMPYPDEGGRHLEVMNFRSGYGALQVRTADGSRPEAWLYAPGVRDKEAASMLAGAGYGLFVVPAGLYDIAIRRGDRIVRHGGVEVPRDRTRLWLVSDQKVNLPLTLAGRSTFAGR